MKPILLTSILANTTFIVAVIIIILFLIIVVTNIKIVSQAHAMVVERFGAFLKTWQTGDVYKRQWHI